jgi:feruloyl esterase
VGDAADQCGSVGAFLLEVGISSSYHVAKFWGLAEASQEGAKDQASFERASRRSHEIAGDGAPGKPSFAVPAGAPQIVPVDIYAVINRALKAAGLMKTD